jgi:queuosine precursor transporter
MTNLGTYTWRLVALHTLIIAISNYLVTIPVKVFGFDLTWAAFTFPLIVVATDLTVRLSDKHRARRIVTLAYIPAIMASTLVIQGTGAPFSVALRVGIASGTAYLLSNLLDVYVFQKIRERYNAWWAAPAFSSVVANIIDTFAFFAVAFYNSADPFMAANWPSIAEHQTVTKIIVSAIIILPVYGVLLTWLSARLGRDIGGQLQN